MSENVNSEQRLTQAQVAKLLGCSRTHVNNLKKKGKLIFEKDSDGKERISYSMALQQYEGSRDYNRDPQRAWAETQRNGKAVNLPGSVNIPTAGTASVDNPHGLPEGNTPAILLQPGDIKCLDANIGRETQRSKLVRETFEAKLAELEYKEKCGKAISIEGMIEANRRIAGSIRSKFIGLGTKLAPRLEGKSAAEIQVAIEDEINAIFTELFTLGGGKEEE